MIAFVFGTTGELIKIAPVIAEIKKRSERPLLLCTGQQAAQLPECLDDLRVAPPDVWLGNGAQGADLERTADVPRWLATVLARFARRRPDLTQRLASDGREPLVLVHGDTMTTVLGAVMAKLLGATSGHIEAGLRSGDWRNPFPEELDRRVAARLVGLHFAPGVEPAENLRRERVRGRIVNTGENTVRDAIDLVAARAQPAVPLPGGRFGLVSLHRFELLERPELLRATVAMLRAHAAAGTSLLFVDHPVTVSALRRHGLDGFFGERLRRIPRQRYVAFIGALRRTAFVVTDSGGSQEECAYLGIPCLVHRVVSERNDGLEDGSCVLSGHRIDVLEAFLGDPERHRRPPIKPVRRPSVVIADELTRIGAI